MKYGSPNHRALIGWAIRENFSQNLEARNVMLETNGIEYTHNIGKFDSKVGKTSLWKTAFVRILHDLREHVIFRSLAPTAYL